MDTYDREVRSAIARLGDGTDALTALRLWENAIGSRWQQAPVWVHGDVSPENMLVGDGKLNAGFDFGCCGVRDRICDLTLAWTFSGLAERGVFQAALPLDRDPWMRGRGWTLWKALISLAGKGSTALKESARHTLEQVLENSGLPD